MTGTSGRKDRDPQYGPLGPGHAPEKDPMKGIAGVMSATMCMEAITFYLALTVIARVDGGAHWSAASAAYVTIMATVMLVVSFLQRYRWSIPVNLALQAVALGGFFFHYSLGIVACVFIAVWWYVLHLRSSLIARMKRGLLTTQHM
ncbi:DUF4233 domain-containing protein [Corynebacterium mastitidis]|uniref:DUF4233 domain-containing protein n=1 Tax=Corynebacterium mastitidis TaxID=161890 RepID=UPI00254D4188|nr:DUF4233 domain-containing protein [Corynebacterium mastitidis]MDK8451031.1 DUF4233 domain-containing protein [Corynebacterium mastitidis]